MKKYIRKDDEAVSPVIAVILMVAITVVLAGVLYVWVSGFGTGGSTGVSISKTKDDKTSYWKINIVKVSGGSLNLDDAKFRMVTKADTSLYTKTSANINPTTKLTSGQSSVYPVATTASVPVRENATLGDGDTVDSASIANPSYWELCYFAYVDETDDGKINAGDTIWIFKDNNADGTNDIESGYVFKILDGKDNEVLKQVL